MTEELREQKDRLRDMETVWAMYVGAREPARRDMLAPDQIQHLRERISAISADILADDRIRLDVDMHRVYGCGYQLRMIVSAGIEVDYARMTALGMRALSLARSAGLPDWLIMNIRFWVTERRLALLTEQEEEEERWR